MLTVLIKYHAFLHCLHAFAMRRDFGMHDCRIIYFGKALWYGRIASSNSITIVRSEIIIGTASEKHSSWEHLDKTHLILNFQVFLLHIHFIML